MNVDSYSTSINCYTTFKKGNFEIFAIYLHWKLKVDMYCGTKNFSKRDMYCGTEGVEHKTNLLHRGATTYFFKHL